MNINRNNYEFFFLLYVDNELSAAEKLEVEQFLQVNPDLRIELDMLASAVLPEEPVRTGFPDKSKLFRTEDEGSLVNLTNHEEYFVQYADDELSNEEKAATEQFVYTHPELQAEFELIQRVKMSADAHIVFPDKQRLYRTESGKIRPLFPIWTRYAAAALVLLALGLFWITNSTHTVTPANNNQVAVTDPPTPAKPEKEESNQVIPQETARPVLAARESGAKNTEAPSLPVDKESHRLVQPLAVTTKTSVSPSMKASMPSASDEKPLPSIGTVANNLEEPIAGSITKIDLTQRETTIIPVQPSTQPVLVALNDNSREDIVFVPGKEVIRKTPLRGLLRKAGRFIDKNNPLSEDRVKPGVFTASNEQ